MDHRLRAVVCPETATRSTSEPAAGHRVPEGVLEASASAASWLLQPVRL
jgi:hypothetical protein